MAANQLTVKAWKGATADIPSASVVENGRLAFYVDTSASTHVVKVCRKVSGTPTWQDVAIASEVLSTTILTTQGDLLVRGASGAERLAIGGEGEILRSGGLGPGWSDPAKQSPAADRPTAAAGYKGVVYYATDTYGVSFCIATGVSTHAWTGLSQMIPFAVTNVAAGDNATAASSTPVQAQWAGAAAVGVGWTAPRAGSVRSLSATLSAAAAGSDLLVAIYKNGTLLHASTLVTLASATGDTKNYENFPLGAYTFAAGDTIDVRIRTGSGWSASSADLGIAVEIEC